VLSSAPLVGRPVLLVLVVALGNLGLAAVGTVAGALTVGLPRRGSLLMLLALPVVTPLILGAAETTRLMMAAELDIAFWRWLQVLAVFAGLFCVLGTILFEFALEN
jgi:heme exporter protein B